MLSPGLHADTPNAAGQPASEKSRVFLLRPKTLYVRYFYLVIVDFKNSKENYIMSPNF
jgi:hypothetical protein